MLYAYLWAVTILAAVCCIGYVSIMKKIGKFEALDTILFILFVALLLSGAWILSTHRLDLAACG